MVSLKIENAPLTRVAPAAGAGRKASVGTFREGLAAGHCGPVILHVGESDEDVEAACAAPAKASPPAV
jgi:hypothetical protein